MSSFNSSKSVPSPQAPHARFLWLASFAPPYLVSSLISHFSFLPPEQREQAVLRERNELLAGTRTKLYPVVKVLLSPPPNSSTSLKTPVGSQPVYHVDTCSLGACGLEPTHRNSSPIATIQGQRSTVPQVCFCRVTAREHKWLFAEREPETV